MTEVTVALPSLHEHQVAVRDDDTRHRVLGNGRRWGKTRLGTALCIEEALKGGRAWWVAPSYKMAAVGWRMLKEFGRQIPVAHVRLGEKLIEFPNGGSVMVRSADDPESLRGEGLDFVVMDECAFMKESAWTHSLRPALSDREGRALFISTPKGRNWFWRLFIRGQDPEEGDWASYNFTTASNPYISPDEIADAEHDLPERIFRQEYLAEFIDSDGAVFRGVTEITGAPILDKGVPGNQYVMGADWGKMNDFTVLVVVDLMTTKVVHIDRFNEIDYVFQRGRLKNLWEAFNRCAVVAEENSMGMPVIEELRREGIGVQAFKTTNASKANIIESLSLAIERKELQIPSDELLIGELLAFEGVRLASGMMKYGAPEGMHDDMVMSLALAHWGATGGSPWLL